MDAFITSSETAAVGKHTNVFHVTDGDEGWDDPILRVGIGLILVKISGSNIEKNSVDPILSNSQLNLVLHYRI